MDKINHRQIWLDAMFKIAEPVLVSLSNQQLKQNLPVEFHNDRKRFAPLEAFARLICGMAPWIENGTEQQRDYYENLILKCISIATYPNSKDYMDFCSDGQPLVDTAFLCHALVRAPRLIDKLDTRTKTNLISALKSSRTITPGRNNWLLFSAMVETALYLLGQNDYDKLRIDYAVSMFMDWYKGDSIYGDGKDFHWDYYNSFVIQPMLVDIVNTFEIYSNVKSTILERATRYASILERMIAPDGTYPIIGRSITYRFGVFQLLSQAALQHFLDNNLKPAQVRCALTQVITNIMNSPNLFDKNGWLQAGVYGYQPNLAEPYINVGSLYLCSTVFLALGLTPDEPFWVAEDEKWTSKKVWNGEFIPLDHSI